MKALMRHLVLPGIATAMVAVPVAGAKTGTVRLTTNVWASSGACAPTGIGASVYVNLPSGYTQAKAVALEQTLRPKGLAKLTISSRIFYNLTLAKTRTVSPSQLVWNFREIPISKTTAAAYVKRSATLSYLTTGGASKTFQTSVQFLACG